MTCNSKIETVPTNRQHDYVANEKGRPEIRLLFRTEPGSLVNDAANDSRPTTSTLALILLKRGA